MRQVGDGFALVREQLADADRQPVEPGTRAADLRRAGLTAGETGAGLPSSRPDGRTIVTGVLVSAFTWSTVSRRLAVSSVVTSGAIDWACAVAALIARSAASVRSTSASGTRKETRTSELVATTSRLMRALMKAG